MTVVVSLSELRQRTGSVLSRAIDGREDIIINKYGQEYAVVISRERYKQLIDAAYAPVRERSLEAQKAVHESTARLSEDEIEELVTESIRDSRRHRGSPDG